MSEDCCHDTSASNVYTAAWQEIVKPKALELHVLLSEQLLAIVGTEWSDQPQFMRRTCFSPFKPHLHSACMHAAQRNSSEQYLCRRNVTVAKVLTVP